MEVEWESIEMGSQRAHKPWLGIEKMSLGETSQGGKGSNQKISCCSWYPPLYWKYTRFRTALELMLQQVALNLGAHF